MLTRAQGGVTLGPEQGEPGADFTDLGAVDVAPKEMITLPQGWYPQNERNSNIELSTTESL
jgi:hypothetical protein